MLNKIIVQGRLTANPELRRTQSGTAVASATVAVDRDFKNQDGSRDTDFISIVAWKGTGEMLAKYFEKGQMILLSGRLQLRDWTDKEGNKRRTAEIVADSIHFCGAKREDGAPAQITAGNAAGHFEELAEEDSDLPF